MPVATAGEPPCCRPCPASRLSRSTLLAGRRSASAQPPTTPCSSAVRMAGRDAGPGSCRLSPGCATSHSLWLAASHQPPADAAPTVQRRGGSTMWSRTTRHFVAGPRLRRRADLRRCAAPAADAAGALRPTVSPRRGRRRGRAGNRADRRRARWRRRPGAVVGVGADRAGTLHRTVTSSRRWRRARRRAAGAAHRHAQTLG